MSQYRATISPSPTFGYGLAHQRIADADLEGVDLSSWQFALCGAETVVPDVLRAFRSRFAPWGFRGEALTPVYGLSEAALAVTFTPPHRGFASRRFDRPSLSRGVAREAADGREIVSVGRPIDGFEIRIVDEDQRPRPRGRVGAIECRGPSLMEGYLGQPEPTARTLRPDGWLATGDLGFLCDGELYIAGRRTDMLLIRGSNHSPEEVEQPVQEVEGVRRGCAVAASWLPEGAEGEELLLFVEARRGVARDHFSSIAASCRHAVIEATGLAPHRVLVLPPGTLPRTSSGKLRRRETLRRYLASELAPAAPVTRRRLAHATASSLLGHVRARWRLLFP